MRDFGVWVPQSGVFYEGPVILVSIHIIAIRTWNAITDRRQCNMLAKMVLSVKNALVEIQR